MATQTVAGLTCFIAELNSLLSQVFSTILKYLVLQYQLQFGRRSLYHGHL